jgi:hypothetical protein
MHLDKEQFEQRVADEKRRLEDEKRRLEQKLEVEQAGGKEALTRFKPVQAARREPARGWAVPLWWVLKVLLAAGRREPQKRGLARLWPWCGRCALDDRPGMMRR